LFACVDLCVVIGDDFWELLWCAKRGIISVNHSAALWVVAVCRKHAISLDILMVSV